MDNNIKWEWIKAKDFIDFNPKEVMQKGIISKKIAMDKLEPHSKEIIGYDNEPFNGGTKFKNGDTLMARITPCLENGKIAYVDFLDDDELAFGSTEFIVLREKENISDKNFIYYLAISDFFKKPAEKSMVGSSGRQRVQTNVLKELEIKVPDLNTQKKISSILSYFDNLIKLNKKINHNLEEQIVSIFKKWFFNFEGYDNLVESQIGLIPKGWNVDYLGSGKSCFILSSGIDDFLDSKIYIATADVVDSTIINHDTLISMKDKPSRANMQPVPKSIWFAKMIDSRKLIMVDDYSDDLLENYVFSTGFCGIKCVEKYFYYIWSFILTDEFDTIKNNYCTGTTMMAINNKDVKKIKFVLPDDKTLIKFNKIANPIFEKIYYNNLEIIKLTRIRDALLPKLMSGEIDVSNIKL